MKRKRLLSLLVSILAVVFIYIFIFTKYSINNLGTMKHLGKDLGSLTEILFFIVIALFVLRFIIKFLNQKGLSYINNILNKFNLDISSEKQKNILNSKVVVITRKVLIYFSKILQKSHIFIAMVATFIVFIHAYIFLVLGFEWDFGYICGVLAALDLIVLLVSGYFRIFNKGIHSHKFLGILFIILMMLHISFV